MQRDKSILKFLEDNGALTIAQAGLLFFKDNKHHYDTARKRLLKLQQMGLLKHYTNPLTNEKTYYTEKKLSFNKEIYNISFNQFQLI